MKTYTITVTFDLEDEDCSIEHSITTEGLEKVQEELALGFSDPNFKIVKAKIVEKVWL